MARGSLAKEEIAQKILDTFENSFRYDKEIRIPYVEMGETIEIKVTLTAAKVNVGLHVEAASTEKAATPTSTEITKEEKEEVAALMERLNL